MLNLKKTAVAVLALGSSAVFAGTMGPICTPGNVTVPCAGSAWGVGAQALYLQTVFSGDRFDDPIFFTGDNDFFGDHKQLWSWGFQIEASYYFNTGNDLTVNWYHLDANRSNFLDLDRDRDFDGDGFTIGSRHKTQWDAVNVELGQFVDFSANKKIRFFGGAQFAQIKVNRDFDVNAFGGGFGGFEEFDRPFVNTVIGVDPKFDGAGPRTGINLNYVFGNGLGIYADAAASLLLGTAKGNRTQNSALVIGNRIVDAGSVVITTNLTTIVPELEAKLGAKYVYPLEHSSLTLDVGYMWFNYFNAIHSIDAFNCKPKMLDFGADGPYVGLKYIS